MCDGQRKSETYGEEEDGKCVFCVAERRMSFSQGHPLSCDIHGARQSLSVGHSPSAPADKSGHSMCSCQTPQVCIVALKITFRIGCIAAQNLSDAHEDATFFSI